MLSRRLNPPKSTALLLGPRGTGKSTWIASCFADPALRYDLLDSKEYLRLTREPGLLYQEAEGLKPQSWVVIDEVQRVPALLNEVHRLIESKKLRFILSGSSARKLKRGGANLLAGRAMQLEMYPLVSAELGDPISFFSNGKIVQMLETGMLPSAQLGDDAKSYLRAYVETYLHEEIRAEALTRNIGGFSRFLEVAARQNGQVTNISNISRDAEVARQTVQGYFDILQDTLLGRWLPAWKLKRSTKQVAHPKFFFFDTGVVRALSGRLPYPMTPEEGGSLLETLILHELSAWLSYSKTHYPLHFWRSHEGSEVDFFFETARGYLAIEVKSSKRWERSFNGGLNRLKEELRSQSCEVLGVYAGDRPLTVDGVRVLPVGHFLSRLWSGELIK